MPTPTLFERFASLFRAPESAALAIGGPVAERRHEIRSDSLLNPLTGLGSTTADKGSVARPNPWILPLNVQELQVLYEMNGIARRIVDIIPARACRRGWSVPELGGEDGRLRVWERVQEAMSMARLHGGAAMLVVTEDDVPTPMRADPYAWLRLPLDPRRVGRVLALQVFDATEAFPGPRWNDDVRSPGFRGPAEWTLRSGTFGAVVHASRVVWFRGARRPPGRLRFGSATGMPDDSSLQSIWDEIRRLTETLQGGAVLAQELRQGVLTIRDFARKTTGDEAAALQARINLMSQTKSLLGVQIMGDGDSYQSLSAPPTGFDTLSSAGWEALAAVTGIPQVILMGSTPGGLNTDGESSWEGFRQLVSSYQEGHRHDLEQLYRILYAAQDGPTRGRPPAGWALTFASLDEPNEGKLAETRAAVATSDVAYIGAGVYTAADVARSRFGPGGWSIDLDHSVSPTPAPVPRPTTAGPTVPVQPTRGDAVAPDSCVVLVPAADPGLRDRVAAAIGQDVTAETDPHVTVLYLGTGFDPDLAAEVARVVQEEAAAMDPSAMLCSPALRVFPRGNNGTPVVLEYADGWALGRVHDRLLVRLAHLITARQHPTYRPHLTVGYAADPIGPTEAAALLAIDTSEPEYRVPLAQLEVRLGDQVVVVASAGEPAPPPVEPDPPAGHVRVRGHLRRMGGQGGQETEPA